jgi:hypothetical protein
MIEGSGSGVGSGSIPLTNGSGSGRPKNMWIRWIRIWMRIRIRNTDLMKNVYFQEGEDKRVCKLKPLVPEMSEEDVRKAVEPLVSSSVADPFCSPNIIKLYIILFLNR